MSRPRLTRISLLLTALLWLTTGCPPQVAPPVQVPPGPGAVSGACDAGDAAWVREATLALLGRRPFSEAEVAVAVDAIRAIDAAEGAAAGDGRRAFARSLMRDGAYVERWSEHLMDALYVPRTGGQALFECYGARSRDDDDPALAAGVRDAAGDDGAVDAAPFTYLDLVRSSLVLDDVSPVYRAHLFAMLTKPNGCANVDPVAQELAFRDEIGGTFDAAYVDRDPVCLACHNGEVSVTDRDDPLEDRHWPAFGKLEEAVFGSSFDVDPDVAHGPLRVTDFLGAGGGGFFPILDGALAYCFDEAIMDFTPAFCDAAGGAVLDCDGGFPAFCLSPLDVPSCDAEGVPVCANTPACSNFDFTELSNLVCVDGVAQCEDPNDFAFCGDGVSFPECDANGLAICPPSPAEGEGEGEGEPGGGFTPWGADPVCGTFNPDVPDDIADVDGRFASARGKRATVLDLERSLKRGVDALAVRGVVVDGAGAPDGPDEAFAALVALHVVDGVWREVMGSPLTIATRFPRNDAQREILQSLTEGFVRSHWSLEELLVGVVTHPLFNLPAPADAADDLGCGGEPFALPAVFDPWVLAEPVPVERNNSAADGVHALSSRTLLSAAYAALGWPAPADQAFPGIGGGFAEECFDFPTCEELQTACDVDGICCAELAEFCGGGGGDGALSEQQVQRGIGVFHGISEKGFRGLDFQARLTWESRFGGCASPVPADVVDDIAARAQAEGATLRDAVLALKERIVNEGRIVDAEEEAALSDMVGDLEAAAGADVEDKLRQVCGALLSSPQFQLAGIAPEGAEPTRLSPTRADACAELNARGVDGYVCE